MIDPDLASVYTCLCEYIACSEVFFMANVMTVEQAASYLQLTPDTVRRGARTGKIPAARVCGRWRFLQDELDRWLKSGGENDEPELDAWLVSEADKALHDKRYTSEEVKAALGL